MASSNNCQCPNQTKNVRSTAHVCPQPQKMMKKSLVNPKQLSILGLFIPTVVCYGLASALCLTYFVDWRTIMNMVVAPPEKKNLKPDCDEETGN